jgi:enoyl-CoA hydratase/carnithine racemase
MDARLTDLIARGRSGALALGERAHRRLRTPMTHRHDAPTPMAPVEADGATTAVSCDFPAPGVMRLTLDAAHRRNVLGRATIDRIEHLIESAPEECRVVLISASGPDFCAGYDLREAAASGAEPLIAHESNFASLRRARRPIVVALHGNVIGGGLELALAADVRLASDDTRFALPACALGVVYSKSGTRLLVDELGESTARSMILAGRALGAREALAVGLLSELVERSRLEQRALETASRIASWSPVATSGNRQMLDAVVGRVERETSELRLASFAPGGALAASIERFLSRRPSEPAQRTAPRSLRPPRLGTWRLGLDQSLRQLRQLPRQIAHLHTPS